MTTIEPKQRVVGIDLDGTLLEHASYPELGTPLEGWDEEIEALHMAGVKVAVWTCRNEDEYDTIRAHLESHGIEIDYINENPHEGPSTSPKVYFDWYVDDRAVNGFDGVVRGMAARILAHKPWHKRNPLD